MAATPSTPRRTLRARLAPGPADDEANAEILGAAGGRGYKHGNLLRTLGHAPAMLRAWCGLTWPLRDDPAVPRDLRELAIMRVAQLKDSEYEWAHHWLMATAAGVAESKLQALSAWESSSEFDELEREVLAYVDAIVAGPAVPDEVFEPIGRRFAPAELVELTMTITTYIGIAHFLGALQIDVEQPIFEQLGHTKEEL